MLRNVMMAFLLNAALDDGRPGGAGGSPPTAPPNLPAVPPPPTPPAPTPEMLANAARLSALQPGVQTTPVNTHTSDAARALEAAEQRARAAEQRAAELAKRTEQQNSELANVQTSLNSLSQQLHQSEMRAYQAQLAGYRQQVIAQYSGQIIPGMVQGNTPEEIQRSAVEANKEWLRAFNEGRASVPATAGTPPVPPQGAPAPLAAVPSPAFVQPPGVPGGFPTPANAPAVLVPVAPPLQAFTTEQAVRNGTYAQNRNAILAGIQQGAVAGIQYGPQAPQPYPPPAPQFAPQQFFPPQMPQQQLPGGVMTPAPAPAVPGQLAGGSFTPTGQPATQMAAAQASIAALRNGQGAAAADPLVQRALHQGPLQPTGNAQQTFQQRFNPTPPIPVGNS